MIRLERSANESKREQVSANESKREIKKQQIRQEKAIWSKKEPETAREIKREQKIERDSIREQDKYAQDSDLIEAPNGIKELSIVLILP